MPRSTVTELRAAPAAVSGRQRPVVGQAVPYDFRRPAKLTREHVRVLQVGFDTFARRLTTLLTSGLRQVCTVEMREVSQQHYDEYIGDAAGLTLMMPIEASPIGTGAMSLSLPVALAAIDHMLGGPGGNQPTRALTDIETALFDRLVDQILSSLSYALTSAVALDLTAGKIEYNPQFLQIANPGDSMVIAEFDLAIARESCLMTICLPLTGLLPHLALARPRDFAPLGGTAANQHMHNHLADLSVELQVSFATLAIDSSAVLGLAVGDLVQLPHRVGAPLAVTVGPTLVARAIAGKSGTALAALIVDSPAQLSKESS